MQGFIDCLPGRCCAWLVGLISVLFGVIFVTILYGYYNDCQFEGIDNACFYGDYNVFGDYQTNSEVMFSMWLVWIFWTVGLIAKYDTVWNSFRLPVPIGQAKYICVTVAKDAEVTVANPTSLLTSWMDLIASTGSNTSHYSKTVAVETTEMGHNFIVFECKRYVLNTTGDRMVEAHAGIGPVHDDIREAGKGLSTGAHRSMINHVGPNLIPFGVAPLGELISNEAPPD